PQPRWESRSGASTERFPNSRAGRTQSQIGTWMLRTVNARNNIRTGCGSAGVAAGVRQAKKASTSARPATTLNAVALPGNEATAPSTGPKRAPAIAAPNADPISCPRRPPGAAATSHESDPGQGDPPDTPCQKRARAS